MPYIDLDLRPAAAVVLLTMVLIAVIRGVERYAHTSAARRTRRALERALQREPNE